MKSLDERDSNGCRYIKQRIVENILIVVSQEEFEDSIDIMQHLNGWLLQLEEFQGCRPLRGVKTEWNTQNKLMAMRLGRILFFLNENKRSMERFNKLLSLLNLKITNIEQKHGLALPPVRSNAKDALNSARRSPEASPRKKSGATLERRQTLRKFMPTGQNNP